MYYIPGNLWKKEQRSRLRSLDFQTAFNHQISMYLFASFKLRGNNDKITFTLQNLQTNTTHGRNY